jgi:chromosome segregation ATPase
MAEPINLELLARHLQGIRAALRDMQFHAENDRRNVRSQFDNLAASHGSQLGDVEAKLAARLDNLETLLGERFAHLDERVGRLEERVGQLDERVSRLDEKIGQLDERLGRLDERVGRLEDRMEYLITLTQQLLKK